MYNKNLVDLSNSLLDFLFIIKDNVLSEKDIIKKIPCAPKEIEDYIDKYPLPPSHMKVIQYLIHNNSCPISQIAKSLNISKPNMTPIIDKLINYNLVKRYTDTNDRRIIRVELTQEAIDIFNDVKNVLINQLCKKLSNLPDEDLKILDSSLNNISEIIQKL